MTGLTGDWIDRLMNIRLDRWDYALMNGLLVGRIAKRGDGLLDSCMND